MRYLLRQVVTRPAVQMTGVSVKKDNLCPYENYEIMPNPEGIKEPWYSEAEWANIIWIQKVGPPFTKVMLKEGEEWYDYFITKQ